MPQITDHHIFSKSDNFVETEVDGETVLMDIENGQFSSLAGTGKAIWDQIDGRKEFSAIIAQLIATYDVDETECRQQVGELLSELLEKNLVTITGPANGQQDS